MQINPFNITKAVDYSDELIKDLWVDIPGDGFESVLKPTSPMPMIILGSKGSGKTHIMRYFSYKLQKIRYEDNFIDELQRDSYLGIYLRCNGLNSHKFQGKGVSEDTWNIIFQYYMELWLSQLVLNITIDITNNHKILTLNKESKICESIRELLDISVGEEIDSFVEIKKYLERSQKEVDYEVNNIALYGNKFKDLRINITPGRLTFGLPKLLAESISIFKNINFLYLIDEYENLTENQQKYINTLVREKEIPTTFKIGTRRYGVKTIQTFSAEEEIKEGSEYEHFDIDELFRSRESDYKKFVKNICIKRLINNGYKVSLNSDNSYIDSYFEEFNLDGFLKNIDEKKGAKNKSYFKKLAGKLRGIEPEKTKKIIDHLACDNRLIERTNLLIFYRAWKNSNENFNLVEAARNISQEADRYLNDKSSNTNHHKVLDKYKNDIIDQLSRECGVDVMYLGLDNFIKMSSGIPRNLLIILKHIFRWSKFKGEKSFQEDIISADVQGKGLRDASNWFLEDARMPGEIGKKIQVSISRLGLFLQEIRFSDLPPECSISSFRLNLTELESDVIEVLDYLLQYSYLIKVDQRRDKNSNRLDVTYQINGLLAPKWELSIHRRGVLSLNKEEARAIFSQSESKVFKKHLSLRLGKYNAPFQKMNPTLF